MSSTWKACMSLPFPGTARTVGPLGGATAQALSERGRSRARAAREDVMVPSSCPAQRRAQIRLAYGAGLGSLLLSLHVNMLRRLGRHMDTADRIRANSGTAAARSRRGTHSCGVW